MRHGLERERLLRLKLLEPLTPPKKKTKKEQTPKQTTKLFFGKLNAGLPTYKAHSLFLSKMSFLEHSISKENLATFGYDLSIWTEDHQELLRQDMLLICRENPDWTERQVNAECRTQVEGILFEWFKETLGRTVQEVNYWTSELAAFKDFLGMPSLKFTLLLIERQEISRFWSDFYPDLREHSNICSAGMQEEFEKMKANKWSFYDYRTWLQAEIARKARMNRIH
jgi:hypothetical protein